MEENVKKDLIEQIKWNEKPMAFIVRAKVNPSNTTFVTPPDLNLQVGYVVHPGGYKIPRHSHREIERRITGTSEVLVVKRGKCKVNIYNDDQELIGERYLNQGDVIILIGGGHEFHMMSDTILLEIKQGPYFGESEKEFF
jgi:hypothetical protein